MNVAIVDDTQINIVLMQALIGKVGDCTAHCFTHSAEGLNWCLNNEPDLIIVDYMMPAPDGIEFIQRFRAEPNNAEVPILMVTADHEKEVRYRALESGATDFLTKPVDRMEFLSRVRNMLALRRSYLVLSSRARTLAEEVRLATEEILARERETVARLVRAAEFRDDDTGSHIRRMAHYSRIIAAKLGLSEEFQDMLFQAAPMHDVGKMGIRDNILLKQGKLTAEEFEIMKGHATHGYEILKDSSSAMLQMAARIALAHHEKFDGSGYPQGLAGEAIPIEGRIVAVADVFDALTSSRPYKKAWPEDQARALLEEGRGKHFDPQIVDAFLAEWPAVLEIKRQYQDEL